MIKPVPLARAALTLTLLVAASVAAKPQIPGNQQIGIGIDLNEGQNFASYFSILNIENPLYPNYIDSIRTADIQQVLSYSSGKYIVVDGPFIDINPGTTVNRIRGITYQLCERSIAFADAVHAGEIIFLSTFIPQIRTASYDSTWLNESASFWTKICNEHPDIRVSLCNTFETSPDILLEVFKKVNCKNFGLAFDIGHALMYSEIGLDRWYGEIEKFVNTVYIHSNIRKGDIHLPFNQGVLLRDKGFQNIKEKIKSKNVILKQNDKRDFKEVLAAWEQL